jgi:exodeoxyribonuclease V alpha subunit
MTPIEMLQMLSHWRDEGWLRRLDLALASLVHETDASAPASLLLAAALAAQLEGHGHSGLPLDELAADPTDLLGWQAEAAEALRACLAVMPIDAAQLRAAWQGLLAVQIDPVDATGTSPLVLSGRLLYLRRYWRYETRIASQIQDRVAGGDPIESGSLPVDRAAARTLLDRLFARPSSNEGKLQGGATEAATEATTEVATDWQKVACALALRGRLTLVTGGPGTGKTYTAARLLVLLQALHRGPQPLRVALAAPTGKAAARLQQAIKQALQHLRSQLDPALPLESWAAALGPARTLHALLGTVPGSRRFRHDAFQPLDLDVLFVDEASMVHLEMMAELLDALPRHCRLVLLGDKDQLSSVEAGAVMADLCQSGDQGEAGEEGGERGALGASTAPGRYIEETATWIHQTTGQGVPAETRGRGTALAQQTVMLRHSHRFDGPIGQLALAVNRGDASLAQHLLQADGSGPVAALNASDAAAVLPLVLHGRAGAPGGYRPYLELLAQRPAENEAGTGAFTAWAKQVLRRFDDFRVLCAVREGAWGVSGVNAAIERALLEAGLLPRRGGEWYEGRPVMVTRNSPELGVFNGDIGIVLRAHAGASGLRCHFLDGDELHSVSVARLADVETAFAMTVHKSQGSEFAHVVLVLPDEDLPVLTRELVYTGITRARTAFTLVARPASLFNHAVKRLTHRVSGLRARLHAPR